METIECLDRKKNVQDVAYVHKYALKMQLLWKRIKKALVCPK